jgi:hypothetical protein
MSSHRVSTLLPTPYPLCSQDIKDVQLYTPSTDTEQFNSLSPEEKLKLWKLHRIESKRNYNETDFFIHHPLRLLIMRSSMFLTLQTRTWCSAHATLSRSVCPSHYTSACRWVLRIQFKGRSTSCETYYQSAKYEFATRRHTQLTFATYTCRNDYRSERRVRRTNEWTMKAHE